MNPTLPPQLTRHPPRFLRGLAMALVFALVLLAFGVLERALGQSRSDTFDPAAAKVVAAQFVPLQDGSCILSQACVQLDSLDGGASLGSCVSFDEQSGRLGTTNANRCNALLDVALRRFLRAQRFAVDAGG